MDLIEHALEYAARGWHVFPVKSDKRPYTRNGFKDATTDEKQIRKWWKQWPHAGIGLATGERSGVWVLDVDGENGQRSIAEFELDCDAQLPRTLSASTPSSRSAHHYFSIPVGVEVRSKVGVLPNVDIRGCGGYVILPPSECVNKEDEQRPYKWLNNDDPLDPEESEFITALLGRLSNSKSDRAPTPAATSCPPSPRWGAKALSDEVERVSLAPEGQRNPTLNLAAWKVGKVVGGGHLDEDEAIHSLLDASRSCGLLGDDGEAACLKTIRSGIEAGKLEPAHPKAKSPAGKSGDEWIDVPFPKTAYSSLASAFHEKHVYWNEEVWLWFGDHYEPVSSEEWDAIIHRFLARVRVPDKEGEPRPIEVNTNQVRNVRAAIRANGVVMPRDLVPPCRISERSAAERSDLMSFRDQVLDVEAGVPHPNDGSVFSPSCLPFELSEIWNARCPQWHKFMEDCFPDDRETVRTLKLWMGYLLTGDKSHHKMAVILGPPRSGKGVLQSVWHALYGSHAIASTTLPSLAGRFGAQPVVGKSIVIIPDMRFSGGFHEQAQVAQMLLSLSGDDHITVDRKNKQPLHLRLPGRLTVFTNEHPKIQDVSGALMSRVLPMPMGQSFVGREDRGLTKRLLGELPGIAKWALDGLHELRRVGEFPVSAKGNLMLDEMMDTINPLAAFVREILVPESSPDYFEETMLLYERYVEWADVMGLGRPMSVNSFSGSLLKTLHSKNIRAERNLNPETRRSVFHGIRSVRSKALEGTTEGENIH